MSAVADSSLSSSEERSIIDNVFGAFASIFSSKPQQIPSALRTLRLATRLSDSVVSTASYRLFKTIMTFDNLTDEHWEAARLAICAVAESPHPAEIGEPKEILRFIDHHVLLEGEGREYEPCIGHALRLIVNREVNPLTFTCFKEFDWASPPFVRRVRSMMQPHNRQEIRRAVVALVALVLDRWFNCSVPVMEPEEMSEFCENLTQPIQDVVFVRDERLDRERATIAFGLLRSPDWREQVVPELWRTLPLSILAEELESVRWCLRNAIELLDFMKGLPNREGLKWWCGMLYLHFDKLDSATRDEVQKITAAMRSDGLTHLRFCRDIIGAEISRMQDRVDLSRGAEKNVVRTRLAALEGNYQQLDRIIDEG